MKTCSSSALVCLAVLSAALAGPLAAASSTPAAIAVYRVRAVDRDGITILLPGDSATQVAAYLGYPDQMLSRDNWVYRRFQSPPTREQAQEGCTLLLVTFSEGRVSLLRRVNEPAITALAARLAVPPASRGILAGNRVRPGAKGGAD